MAQKRVIRNPYHSIFATARKRPCKPRSGWRQRGFTLIEIVVALAVLGIAMGAILTGAARYADSAAHLRDKTLALWVAHNRLTEITLERAWPALGKNDGTAEMAGARWDWQSEVKETPDPKVRRVEVSVRREDGKDELIRLAAFLSSSGRGG